MKTLFTIALLALLGGCMSTQKAADYLKDKGKLAELCAQEYPPRDSVVIEKGEDLSPQLQRLAAIADSLAKVIAEQGTEYIIEEVQVGDTAAHRQCNDAVKKTTYQLQVARGALSKIQNQLFELQARYKQCENKTTWQPNTAEIDMLKKMLEREKKNTASVASERDTFKAKFQKAKKHRWWLILIAGLLLGWTFRNPLLKRIGL